AEDGIRDFHVTGVQTCARPICPFQVALDTATAQWRQADVLASQAQADFDRAQRLVSTGAVSRKTYDDAASMRRARLAQAQAAKRSEERRAGTAASARGAPSHDT